MTTIESPAQVPAATEPTLGILANAEQPNLELARYGYDLVCATTQDSIDATMKERCRLVAKRAQ